MSYDPSLKTKNRTILAILLTLITLFFIVSFVRTKESSWSSALKKQHLIEKKRKPLSKN